MCPRSWCRRPAPFPRAFEIAENPAGHALPYRGEERAFLDLFARHVERQVGGIDQPAHEAQIARQNLGLVGDEDALDVQLDAALAIGIEQVERPRARKKARAVYSWRPSARK